MHLRGCNKKEEGNERGRMQTSERVRAVPVMNVVPESASCTTTSSRFPSSTGIVTRRLHPMRLSVRGSLYMTNSEIWHDIKKSYSCLTSFGCTSKRAEWAWLWRRRVHEARALPRTMSSASSNGSPAPW